MWKCLKGKRVPEEKKEERKKELYRVLLGIIWVFGLTFFVLFMITAIAPGIVLYLAEAMVSDNPAIALPAIIGSFLIFIGMIVTFSELYKKILKEADEKVKS